MLSLFSAASGAAVASGRQASTLTRRCTRCRLRLVLSVFVWLYGQEPPVSAPRWAEALLLPIVVFISISLLIAFACHHWRKYVDPRSRANN